MRITSSLAFALGAVLLGSTAARAHEIGTTRVSALLKDGRYAVEVVTDAAALAEKLDAVSDRARPRPFGDVYVGRVHVMFDGVETIPSVDRVLSQSADGATRVATIRLTGALPTGAKTFSWKYGWTFASYALTVRRDLSDNSETQWLEGGDTSAPFNLSAPTRTATDRLRTAWRYFALGFTHIVPYGFDHVLFVLGIFLLGSRPRTVLWQVSAFTVAHSITLGLSLYGFVTAPPAIVEPLIALSIAYVAIENVFLSELRSWRVALVFAFGLLHGMGFAGALKELGLRRADFLAALLTFNLGVEAGQLAVLGTAFTLVAWPCRRRDWYRRLVVVPASVLIACTALYWTVERLR